MDVSSIENVGAVPDKRDNLLLQQSQMTIVLHLASNAFLVSVVSYP